MMSADLISQFWGIPRPLVVTFRAEDAPRKGRVVLRVDREAAEHDHLEKRAGAQAPESSR